jgi:hypothetical protein
MKAKRTPIAKAAPDPPPPPPPPAEIPFEEPQWCGCVVAGIMIGATRKYERVTRFCNQIHPDPNIRVKMRIRRTRSSEK